MRRPFFFFLVKFVYRVGVNSLFLVFSCECSHFMVFHIFGIFVTCVVILRFKVEVKITRSQIKGHLIGILSNDTLFLPLLPECL